MVPLLCWVLSHRSRAQSQPTIHECVHDQDDDAEDVLRIAGQACGIEEREEIAREKILFVPWFTAAYTKPIFDGRQGTDPSSELDHRAPDCCRKMNPCDLPPFDDQESPANDKEDEGEMTQHDKVGKNCVQHSEFQNRVGRCVSSG